MVARLIGLVRDVISIKTKPIPHTGLSPEEQISALDNQNREMKMVYNFLEGLNF